MDSVYIWYRVNVLFLLENYLLSSRRVDGLAENLRDTFPPGYNDSQNQLIRLYLPSFLMLSEKL